MFFHRDQQCRVFNDDARVETRQKRNVSSDFFNYVDLMLEKIPSIFILHPTPQSFQVYWANTVSLIENHFNYDQLI